MITGNRQRSSFVLLPDFSLVVQTTSWSSSSHRRRLPFSSLLCFPQYTDEVVLWSSETQAPLPLTEKGPLVEKLQDLKLQDDEQGAFPPPSVSSSLVPVASPSSKARTSQSIPFYFSIPGLEEQMKTGNILPPSLDGGKRISAGMAKWSFYSRTVGYNRCTLFLPNLPLSLEL